MVTDDELSKLAEQALLQEAKRGAIRAEISGPSGWLKKKLPSTNKKFLHNTLLGALAANRVQDRKEKSRSEDGKRKRELEEKEKNTYKRTYIHASTKAKVSDPKICVTSEKKEKEEEPKNQVMWSESGLEFTNSSGVKKMKAKQAPNLNGKHKCREKYVMPRNIKFVSSEQKVTSSFYGDG